MSLFCREREAAAQREKVRFQWLGLDSNSDSLVPEAAHSFAKNRPFV